MFVVAVVVVVGGGGGGGFGQFHIVGYTERLSPKGAPALTAPIKRQLWDIT